MSKISLADVLELSVPERIRLVEEIWDSIAADSPPPKLTQTQREELDRRLDDLARSPGDGATWEEVKGRIANGCHD